MGIAPSPVLPGLQRADHDVTGRGSVGPCMSHGGRVAAAHLSAREAEPEVHPGRTQPETLLAAVRARPHRSDECEVGVRGRTPRDAHAVAPSLLCNHVRNVTVGAAPTCWSTTSPSL